MTNLPKDYVILGHIKDINVPKSWETNTVYNYTLKEHLSNWAYHGGDENWKAVFRETGWMPKGSNITVAALIGSPLYNMNLPKKASRARPTVKQVNELNNKILSLEAANGCMEVEIKKLREQLAAIGKIISG
jgi:hypothetical protein